MSEGIYRGRFAPSPTGPLHFGSLVAAVASYADARQHGGAWLVRIEDVDETRTRPGAERLILDALHGFGMHADESPVRQSARKALYDETIEQLPRRDLVFPCICSRKRIAALTRPGKHGYVYPGTCRSVAPPQGTPTALRVKVDHRRISFQDRVVGEIHQDLAAEVGDFVIRRMDGFTAYQLAVVVDDQAQGITDVVRGADLLWSTPRQIYLQRLLGSRSPRYAHVPLVMDQDGRKLSKRDQAYPVDPANPMPALRAAWRHLQPSPVPTGIGDPKAFWRWAGAHWQADQVPKDGNRQVEASPEK